MKLKTIILPALLSFIFISDASCAKKKKPSGPSQKELNEVTLTLARYSNNPEGLPTLHYAVLKNDRKAISLFLKYGADPLSVCRSHYSCLYYAIKSGSLSLIKKFIALGNSHLDVRNMPDNDGYDASTMSLKLGQYEAAKYFILNFPPLHPKRLLQQGRLLLKTNACGFTLQQRKELMKFMTNDIPQEIVSQSASWLLQELLRDSPKEHEMAEFLRSLGAK